VLSGFDHFEARTREAVVKKCPAHRGLVDGKAKRAWTRCDRNVLLESSEELQVDEFVVERHDVDDVGKANESASVSGAPQDDVMRRECGGIAR